MESYNHILKFYTTFILISCVWSFKCVKYSVGLQLLSVEIELWKLSTKQQK